MVMQLYGDAVIQSRHCETVEIYFLCSGITNVTSSLPALTSVLMFSLNASFVLLCFRGIFFLHQCNDMFTESDCACKLIALALDFFHLRFQIGLFCFQLV